MEQQWVEDYFVMRGIRIRPATMRGEAHYVGVTSPIDVIVGDKIS